MYEARIQNRNGEVMLLTDREAVYQVIGINGLDPPSAQINLSNVVGLDGAKYNSGKLNTRNLVLTIKINLNDRAGVPLGSIIYGCLGAHGIHRKRHWFPIID